MDTVGAELDRRILAVIASWRQGTTPTSSEIDRLFLDVARYQLERNAPYRTYAATRGIDATRLHTWRDIPAVPTTALKEALFVCFDPADAARRLLTSGTTSSNRGRHFITTPHLADAAATAIFARLVSAEPMRVIGLVPAYEEQHESSLSAMVSHLIRERLEPTDATTYAASFILHDAILDIARLSDVIAAARRDAMPLCLIGTALNYVALLEHPQRPNAMAWHLPPNSLIIETGGAKNSTRSIDPARLYDDLCDCFAVPRSAVLAEFGMTELSSEYYDSLTSRHQGGTRRKVGPPWLRPRIVDEHGNDVAIGEMGILHHYDLSNRSSVVAIATEDLAIAHEDGFELIGRQHLAEPRGCSLLARDWI